MSSKSKSSLSETPPTVKIPIAKTSPATPRVTKLGRGVAKSEADSASPLHNSRLSVDRSPRTVASKTPAAAAVDRRSPKTGTPPERPATRGVSKGSELQAQLNALQDDLKKAKEKLVSMEKEKEKAIEELKAAQKLSEDTNEKLREALVAQKRAEESSEIEKFRAVEMEQAGIEAAQKKEEGWEKELEAVRNQHAVDMAALVSATQELQKVKQELAMTSDAKNKALTHADDAAKIAEMQAEKVETLSSEVKRMKALLDTKSEREADQSNKLVSDLNSEIEMLKLEDERNNKLVSELKSEIETLKSEANQTNKLTSKLKSEVEMLKSEAEALQSEIETLNQELGEAKDYKEMLLEREAALEELNVELEAARMAESYARSLMEEWKTKVEELDLQAEEAKRLERSASSSLESVVKDLEVSNSLLRNTESELASLKEKVSLLEMSNVRQRGDLEESDRSLRTMKEEASKMAKKTELLKLELETVKEERTQALNNEKLAASSVQTLLEERNKIISELETSRDEEEKSKKALESLASALHEVSSEAREAKEKLLSSQAEQDNYEVQIEDLKLALQATNEKYQSMLEDSKHEIDMLMHSIEQAKHNQQDTESEWKEKEQHLMDCIKKSEEENTSLEKELGRMASLLKETEKEAHASNEESIQLKNTMKQAELEVTYLKEVLGEAKAESMKLKESLMDSEHEVQILNHENEKLRIQEAESLRKVDELSKLLEEAAAREQVEENGDITDSEKDYDMLPKVVEFSEQNGNGNNEIPIMELHTQQPEKEKTQIENEVLNKNTVVVVNGEENEGEKTEKQKESDDSVGVEFKMWESCKIEDKDLSPEREGLVNEESFEEEHDSKSGEAYDEINGVSSTENMDINGGSPPLKQEQQQLKKKKPLLRKFGSLLKKKGTSNNK